MKYIIMFAIIFSFTQAAFGYTCMDYANRAVHQQKAAQSLGCGYTGVRWQTTFQNHFNWCSMVGAAAAGQEDIARQAGLDNCLQQPVTINNCNLYAFRAMKEIKAAANLNCGFAGPRWFPNAGNHKMWCQSVNNYTAVDLEDQARIDALMKCVSK